MKRFAVAWSLIAAAGLAAAIGTVRATPASDPDEDWVEQSRQLLLQGKDSIQGDLPSSTVDLAHRKEAEALQAKTIEQLSREQFDLPGGHSVVPLGAPAVSDAPTTTKYRIFASMALGRETLRDLFSMSAASPDVAIVFRGVPGDMKIGAWVRSLQDLIIEHEQPPSVELDPVRFRDAGITQVPTIVMYEGDTVVAHATGISNPEWLANRVAAGEKGALGQHGPVTEPTERDLLEEIHANVLSYDWEGAHKRALGRYFARQVWVDLPAAQQSRRRVVDPSFEVARDVVLPDGTVLGKVGQRINPLERMPFEQKVVVFDGTDPRQIEIAKREVAPIAGITTTFITTKVDRESGMGDIERMTSAIGRMVTILTPQLRDTLHLERVPAVVTAEHHMLVVREINVGADGDADPDAQP